MNYRNVYRIMSVKNAHEVLIEIYKGNLSKNYRSFNDIQETLKMNKSSLRRITNRLSSCGLIKSVKNIQTEDKRKRVYILSDISIVEEILRLTEELS